MTEARCTGRRGMKVTPGANDEQATLWNGAGGHAWVDAQELLDRMRVPSDLEASHCGELALRGKESGVVAYSLRDSALNPK